MDEKERHAAARLKLATALNSGGAAYPVPNEHAGSGLNIRELAALEFAAAEVSRRGFEDCDPDEMMRRAFDFANAFVSQLKKWRQGEPDQI